VKSVVAGELIARFRAYSDDFRLQITPAVSSAALEAALDDGRLNSVKLVKLDRSSDIAEANEWVSGDTHTKIEVKVSPMERGMRLMPDLAKRAIRGDTNAYGKIIEFRGMGFDHAVLDVTLDGGARRSFDLNAPETGHPFAASISPDMQDGEPTPESVWTELGNVLTEME
jgi:hypothetical protein